MRLYLIRHAQSQNNIVYDGTDTAKHRLVDPEITPIGHRQSEALAQYLCAPGNEPRQHPFTHEHKPDFGITHLYCSLMTRAILTAQYIHEACGIGCEALPTVFEQKGLYSVTQSGELQQETGPGRQYFQDRFPWLNLPDSVAKDGWHFDPVESDAQFIERVASVLIHLLERHQGCNDTVALVSHWGFMDQFVNAVMGIERLVENQRSDWKSNWVFDNTSYSRFDFDNDSRNVVYLNRTNHLIPELQGVPLS